MRVTINRFFLAQSEIKIKDIRVISLLNNNEMGGLFSSSNSAKSIAPNIQNQLEKSSATVIKNVESSLLSLPITLIQSYILPYLRPKDLLKLDSSISDKAHREEFSRIITTQLVLIYKDLLIGVIELEWFIKRKAILTKIMFSSQAKSGSSPYTEDRLVNILSHYKDTLCSIELFIEDLEDIPRRLPYYSHLRIFEIHSSEITDDVGLILSRQNRLHTVVLDGHNSISQSVITSLVPVPASGSGSESGYNELRSLSIIGRSTDEAIIAIAKSSPKLKIICLATDYCCELHSPNLTDASIITLAQCCPDLHTIYFTNLKRITDDSIIAITKYCTKLTSLNLPGCHHISDVSISSILQHCKKHLISLTLINCPLITKEGYINIKNNLPLLTSIHMISTSGAHFNVDPHTQSLLFNCLLGQLWEVCYNIFIYYIHILYTACICYDYMLCVAYCINTVLYNVHYTRCILILRLN